MSESPFVYTGKDTILDAVASPTNLVKALPHYQGVFDQIKELREATDDRTDFNPRTGKAKGGSIGFKVVARMPEALLTWLLVLEPDLVKDAKTFRKFLRKHPEYNGYTNVKV